jgi:hypothetical protein
MTAAGGEGYGAGAFAERGVEGEEVGLDEDDGVPTLAQIDRLLAVARHAPGAVAVHGPVGGGEARGGGDADRGAPDQRAPVPGRGRGNVVADDPPGGAPSGLPARRGGALAVAVPSLP